MLKCPTGKRVYVTEAMAEDALIDAHSRHQYSGTGPISFYQCEDCGYYHFTSKGEMNKKLAEQIASGKIKRQQEANQWMNKLKK
ncbi:MAG TPA: hypothetical protein VGQ59_19735 [Cyclobacteriaceae bacterium]|jgi:hypothetical protein|nr:hypothetical protein [Cyclobacteriaceae bacterium]